MSITSGTAGPELQSLIERLERVAEEKAALTTDAKVIFAEVKQAGFDPKTVRKVIKIRKKDSAEWHAEDALLATYLVALGMAEETPLSRYVGSLSIDLAARDQVVKALSELVPESGELIVKMGGPPLRLYRDSDGEAQVEDYVEAPPLEAAPAPLRTPAEPAPGGRAARRVKVPAGEPLTVMAARTTGCVAAKGGSSIKDNPFNKRDARHAAWVEGWNSFYEPDPEAPPAAAETEEAPGP